MEAASSERNRVQFSPQAFFVLLACNSRIYQETFQSNFGFQNSYRIQINTDSRTRKIEDLKHCPFAELRERAWFATSFKSRLQYLGPDPGRPCLTEQSLEESHVDNSSGPLAAYCLLIIDPEKVDYYNLKSSQRIMFISNQSVNGQEKCWTSERINP